MCFHIKKVFVRFKDGEEDFPQRKIIEYIALSRGHTTQLSLLARPLLQVEKKEASSFRLIFLFILYCIYHYNKQ